jgi:hypothetical protein
MKDGFPGKACMPKIGKRFLMIKESGAITPTGGVPRRINIILNWFEELKQRVGEMIQQASS